MTDLQKQMKVKNTAIIYTGYDYQTLHGVRLLAEWLDSPAMFVRAAFEADEDGNEAPNGIDDIVFERPEGILDFWQVKFSPSPEKESNCLNWSWLLDASGKTEKSRSLLKKFYDAIVKVPAEKLGEVNLLTNKRPDRVMESCLNDSGIDFNKIDENTQSEIVRQLGSPDAAAFLFSKLTIQHSDGDYYSISRRVRTELLRFSDDAGAERLIARAREWAMFKNNPPENGWIYLHHIREILSPKRPEPIPELFSIPEDYCLPDVNFHDSLMAKISASKGEIITLTGKPGAGKSTYLSFLCRELESNEIPLVRHHYFLSLVDTTGDRLSPRIVAESLLHQISRFHKEANADTSQPEKIRESLSACARYYKEKGKIFVVLVDGLDHVWRENLRNKRPLDEIFRQLLPAIDNLVLIVGTQPVDDEFLPNTLLTYSPKRAWHWLPEMSGNSIYEFLKIQVGSGRLFLASHKNHSDEEIRNSAKSLLSITSGYPLHVIYSSEYLAQHAIPLSSWQIERLPSCSDGNIINYYSELWRGLNYKQKDVLHLCSGFQFFWPRQAIGTLVKDEHEYAPSVDAVAHLLSEGLSGITPFHESLVVFVRNQEEHQDRINSLLPRVCAWLSSEAPTNLKDNWLWSCQARSGDSLPLRQGITRDWLLDRLICGMPIKSCLRLLSEAETYAFEGREYAEAYRHRELKTRFLNGPEFQTWNPIELEMLSLVGASKEVLNEIFTNHNEYSPTKLSVLATALWYRGQIEEAKRIAIKSIDRYRNKSKLLSRRYSKDDEDETVAIIRAGLLTESLNLDAIFSDGNFSTWPDEYVNSFRHACRLRRDIELLLIAKSRLPQNSIQIGRIELDAIRLSLIDGFDIADRPEYGDFHSQGLSSFLDCLTRNKVEGIGVNSFDDPSQSVFKVDTSDGYHKWFFDSLCVRLNAVGDYCWLPVKAMSERIEISVHYDLINELACSVAHCLLEESELRFDIVCSIFPSGSILTGNNWELRNADINLKRNWIEIASDCHLVTTRSAITHNELENAIRYGGLEIEWLRLWYKDIGLNLISDDAADLLVNKEFDRIQNELEETIEKSNALLELSQISYQHNNLELFSVCLRKTWDFVLGYGHHKDPTIFEVLKSIEFLSVVDRDSALDILERISPIIFNVTKFTDGDETRHSRHSISSLLARLNPQTAASIYEQNLRGGEWYYAEEAILRLLERCELSSPIASSLFLTGLHSGCYEILKGEIENKNEHAIKLAVEIEGLLGIKVQGVENETRQNTGHVERKIKLQISDYPPSKFEELTNDLVGEYSTDTFWRSWYAYWMENGSENELLQKLVPWSQGFSDRYDGRRCLLDLLFFSQRKLRGKTKAFGLLVAAHNAMNGWSQWHEKEDDSIQRLRIVAEQYPRKVDDFIKLTTSQPDRWRDKFGGLIIPNDKLVFLLAHSGRKEDALRLTLAMVESLEESVRNLPLKRPNWDWRRDDSLDEALTKVLVSRLKIPVPTNKLLVINQISKLILDRQPRIENILIEDLSLRNQESECVEVLCAFFVATSKGYIPPNDFGRHVKARSALSDLILSEIEPNTKSFGTYSFPVRNFIHLDHDDHRFGDYQGTHVPLLYNSCLEREEQKTGIPFTDFYRSEWNNTYSYQPASEINVDYFFGVDRQRSTGQFYTQASHRGRSAFLRTIAVAKKFYGMPDPYAAHLSIPALPLEPAYIGLTTKKPAWLPDWDDQSPLDKDSFIQFVEKILSDFIRANDSLELLALSVPLKIDNNKWIDLALVKAESEGGLEGCVDLEERIGCISYGALLEKKLRYSFNENEKSGVRALAVTPYPFMRYGHWYSDLESRGLYVPNCNIDGKDITGSSENGMYVYSVDGEEIGFSSFWYCNWQPVHPKGIRSFCGTFTAVDKYNLPKWLQFKKQSRQLFVCKATILMSEHSYGEYESKTHEFYV